MCFVSRHGGHDEAEKILSVTRAIPVFSEGTSLKRATNAQTMSGYEWISLKRFLW